MIVYVCRTTPWALHLCLGWLWTWEHSLYIWHTIMSTFKCNSLYFKCAIHHHSFHNMSCLSHLYHKSFCLWLFLLHLVKIYVQLLLYITHGTTVCDDQMRQKSPAAMQTCLCSIWNKHFVIIQLCQHYMPLYELEELNSLLNGYWLLELRFLPFYHSLLYPAVWCERKTLSPHSCC